MLRDGQRCAQRSRGRVLPGVVRGVVGGLAAGTLLIGLSGCGGIGQPAPYDSPGINGLTIPTPSLTPSDFVDRVDNPWLALSDSRHRRFVVSQGGRTVGSIDLEVEPDPVEVSGVAATAVRTTTDLDGSLTVQTALYAQDAAGNVWLVGAETRTEAGTSSWRAGTDGAQAGLAMPADPRLGDGWLAFEAPGQEPVRVAVEDRSRTQVQIRGEADTTTRTVYERGVGLAGVIDLDAGWTAEPEPT